MRSLRFTLIIPCLVALTTVALAGPDRSTESAKIHRGEYLTHSVAMCVQCHSPRDESGAIIGTEEFHGAPVPIRPPTWASTWAAMAINIRGLPGWREDEVIHLLETGQRYNGQRPSSPMPPFRMSREDAEAIVAYLKSLQ